VPSSVGALRESIASSLSRESIASAARARWAAGPVARYEAIFKEVADASSV